MPNAQPRDFSLKEGHKTSNRNSSLDGEDNLVNVSQRVGSDVDCPLGNPDCENCDPSTSGICGR